MEAEWNMEVTVALPIVASIVGVLILMAIGAGLLGLFADLDLLPVSAACTVLAFVIGGFFAMGMIPWGAEFHRYEPVAGVVESTGSRFLPSGNGMEEKYVVKLKGKPEAHGCVDTRCSLLKRGDPVSLMCIRSWVPNGRNGWDCNWGGRNEDG